MPRTKAKVAGCCVAPAKAGVQLIGIDEAEKLMALFKTLANDTRLRLLHALVNHGELCVNSLAHEVALSPQAVSNQLQRLVDRGILRPRRQGNSVYYRVVNACVIDLLDRGICLVRMECPDEP